MLRVKRVYDTVSNEDGFRILVDRLWPRGMSKEKANVALWMRDIAPSAGLRSGSATIKGNGMNLQKNIIRN